MVTRAVGRVPGHRSSGSSEIGGMMTMATAHWHRWCSGVQVTTLGCNLWCFISALLLVQFIASVAVVKCKHETTITDPLEFKIILEEVSGLKRPFGYYA